MDAQPDADGQGGGAQPGEAQSGEMSAFSAELWRWDARRTDTWTFVSLPVDLADTLLDRAGPVVRGFGSVRVEVTVGGSVWRTSMFPDKARGTYVLPVKRAVRTAEGLDTGDMVAVRLRLLDV